MTHRVLFRKEVLDARKNRSHGNVFINTPVNYKLLTIGISVFMISLLWFISCAEFSEKYVVKGYLESTKGVASVFPIKQGVIETCFVKQGDLIKKGDPLFLVNIQGNNLDSKNHGRVLQKLMIKKKLINESLGYKQKNVEKLKKLLQKNYISSAEYHLKQDELVSLLYQKNTLEMELIHFKNNKSYMILSPVDGTVASVIYHEGQSTKEAKPLLKILPGQSTLVAELYIPVPYSGFLTLEDEVIVRYDAYPYAHFGVSKARISEIGHSILMDDEDDNKPIRIGKPYYKVTALLDRQFVTAYGTDRKIQQGMTISGVIVGVRRKIWQWMLDPIYRFYGEMSA